MEKAARAQLQKRRQYLTNDPHIERDFLVQHGDSTSEQIHQQSIIFIFDDIALPRCKRMGIDRPRKRMR
jgi:nitrogen fixation/metabolism regulation signal transduction histidine kinase